MKNKIPTAEDVMIPYFLHDNEDKDLIKSAMIEFAKIHCELQAKTIVNNVETCIGGDGSPLFSVTSILNSYPLTNIK